jgi:hypothetical protein
LFQLQHSMVLYDRVVEHPWSIIWWRASSNNKTTELCSLASIVDIVMLSYCTILLTAAMGFVWKPTTSKNRKLEPLRRAEKAAVVGK